MIKCFSIRLKSLVSTSNKCYKVCDFQGNEDFIPKSQFYGKDYDVTKSDAYWISAWILEKKNIEYSTKKWTMFSEKGKNIGRVEFKHHIPKKITINKIQHDKSLER